MNFERLRAKIAAGTRFLIGSHTHPDGDALGSTLALAEALQTLDKRVVVYNVDGVPANLRFLPGSETIKRGLKDLGLFDTIIIMDCNDPTRVSDQFAAFTTTHSNVLIIDHHQRESIDPLRHFVDPTASATCQMTFDLITEMSIPLTPSMALNLYSGLVVDTGFFRHNNTTPQVFEMAAALVRAGSEPALVSREMEGLVPAEKLRLLSLVLPTLEMAADGEIASIVLTQQMLKDSGALVEYADEFINYPRSVRGVEVAMVIREISHNRFKISLRSKQKVNVQKVAASFEGGGHIHASGCTIEGSLGLVKENIYNAIKALL